MGPVAARPSAEPVNPDCPATQQECQKARRAARFAQISDFPQQQPQTVGRTLDPMRLGHVAQAAQPASASAAGRTDMREGPFTAFAAPAVESPASLASDPAAVAAKGPLIGQVRDPVLHPRDARVRVARTGPVFIRNFLVRAPAVQPFQVGGGRVFDSFGLGQGTQVGFRVRARVLARCSSSLRRARGPRTVRRCRAGCRTL